MTRYARYAKKFNTKTIADENTAQSSDGQLTALEQRDIRESKNQSIDALRQSRNRRSKPVCLRCRNRDHTVKNCPQGMEYICYNCGSNDHTLSRCPNPRGQDLPYASCFICGQCGHLASGCERNENGIYPRGGGCRFCGSKFHLAKDCRPIKEAESGKFVGKSVDPKRENPEDDLLYESLTKLQQEKKEGKKEEKAKKKVKVVAF